MEAISKALLFARYSKRKYFVIFSDSMSALQAIDSQESKNPRINMVLQACQELLSSGKYIEFFLGSWP